MSSWSKLPANTRIENTTRKLKIATGKPCKILIYTEGETDKWFYVRLLNSKHIDFSVPTANLGEFRLKSNPNVEFAISSIQKPEVEERFNYISRQVRGKKGDVMLRVAVDLEEGLKSYGIVDRDLRSGIDYGKNIVVTDACDIESQLLMIQPFCFINKDASSAIVEKIKLSYLNAYKQGLVRSTQDVVQTKIAPVVKNGREVNCWTEFFRYYRQDTSIDYLPYTLCIDSNMVFDFNISFDQLVRLNNKEAVPSYKGAKVSRNAIAIIESEKNRLKEEILKALGEKQTEVLDSIDSKTFAYKWPNVLRNGATYGLEHLDYWRCCNGHDICGYLKINVPSCNAREEDIKASFTAYSQLLKTKFGKKLMSAFKGEEI